MFVGLHVLLAERTQTPELMMGMDEGAAFMGSVQNVMRHYSVQTTQKALDWIALFGTASSMYIPRAVGYNMRKRAEREGRPQAQAPRPTGPVPASKQPGPNARPGSQGPQVVPTAPVVSIQPDFVGDNGFSEAAE